MRTMSCGDNARGVGVMRMVEGGRLITEKEPYAELGRGERAIERVVIK